MEKLTLKLIKIPGNKIEYSVLEQSDGIQRKCFSHSVLLGDWMIEIVSASQPQWCYWLPSLTFFIRGSSKNHDNLVETITINKSVNRLLNNLTQPNVLKIKKSLAEIGVEFNLVTNLYSKNITSKF
jgi:hypothetical protein